MLTFHPLRPTPPRHRPLLRPAVARAAFRPRSSRATAAHMPLPAAVRVQHTMMQRLSPLSLRPRRLGLSLTCFGHRMPPPLPRSLPLLPIIRRLQHRWLTLEGPHHCSATLLAQEEEAASAPSPPSRLSLRWRRRRRCFWSPTALPLSSPRLCSVHLWLLLLRLVTVPQRQRGPQ